MGGEGVRSAPLTVHLSDGLRGLVLLALVALGGDLVHVRRQDAHTAVGAPDGAADGAPFAPGHGLYVDLPQQPGR